MRVAVLVDAAFFLNRYRRIVPGAREHSGEQVAESLHRWACDHMRFDATGVQTRQPVELYRIFVYDCPPFLGKLENPISKTAVDFGKTDLARFRHAFHQRLPQLRKVALRLGHLSEVRNWTIKPDVTHDILRGRRVITDLKPEDLMLDVKQKGVDMRVGVDVASLSYKKLVDRIVLVAGDADFVPAAKLARREGIDFVLDSMHAHINSALYEHIDGLVSMVPAPATGQDRSQPTKGYHLAYSMSMESATAVGRAVRQPHIGEAASSLRYASLRSFMQFASAGVSGSGGPHDASGAAAADSAPAASGSSTKEETKG